MNLKLPAFKKTPPKPPGDASKKAPPTALVPAKPTWFKDFKAGFEDDAAPAPAGPAPTLKELQLASADALSRLESDSALVINGHLGAMLGSRTIGRGRNPWQFEYAYGEKTFRNKLKAMAALNAIENKDLVEAFLLLDKKGEPWLVNHIAGVSYAKGEEQPLERLGHRLRAVQSKVQGRVTTPGEGLRNYRTQTTPFPKPSEEDLAGLKANGLAWKPTLWAPGKGSIHYGDAQAAKEGLIQLMRKTAFALGDPKTDGAALAACFAHEFIILHALPDEDGGVGRMIAERIARYFGLAPCTFTRSGMDIDETLTREQYVKVYKEGISRTGHLLWEMGVDNGQWALPLLTTNLFRAKGAVLPTFAVPAKNFVSLEGMPFSQGEDGFVYSALGRPHCVDSNGLLTPLTQQTYAYLIRAMGRLANPSAALSAYTQSTRDLFAKLAEGEMDARKVAFPEDIKALAGDRQRLALLPASGNEDYIRHFDPALSTPEVLFNPSNSAVDYVSSLEFAMSRYDQVDFQLRNVEVALAKAGDTAGEAQLKEYRGRLHTTGRAFLKAHLDSALVTETNPYGFKSTFEQLKFESSPLGETSVSSWIAKHGDDKIRVWHGDSALDSVIGFQPEGNPLEKTADQLQGELWKREHGTLNIQGAEASISGKSGGSGTQCFTTLPSLLTGDFASGSLYFPVNLAALPAPLANHLREALKEEPTRNLASLQDALHAFHRISGPPEGHVEITGLTRASIPALLSSVFIKDEGQRTRTLKALQAALPEKSKAKPHHVNLTALLKGEHTYVKMDGLSQDELKSIRSAIDGARSLVSLTLAPPDTLQVSVHRRAFLVEAKKDHFVVGPGTEGGAFENEQELTLWTREMPWRVLKRYTAAELKEEIAPAAPIPTASAPSTATPPEQAPQ